MSHFSFMRLSILINKAMKYTTKKCSKCGKRMSINKFYSDSARKDGKRGECKECFKLARQK